MTTRSESDDATEWECDDLWDLLRLLSPELHERYWVTTVDTVVFEEWTPLPP